MGATAGPESADNVPAVPGYYVTAAYSFLIAKSRLSSHVKSLRLPTGFPSLGTVDTHV